MMEETPSNIVTSPPQTIEVQDIDIGLLGGVVQSFTLYPDDSIVESDFRITIEYVKSGERVTIWKRNLLWMSQRRRLITLPAKGKK